MGHHPLSVHLFCSGVLYGAPQSGRQGLNLRAPATLSTRYKREGIRPVGAGDENRTRPICLEGRGATTTLHPQYYRSCIAYKISETSDSSTQPITLSVIGVS